MKKVKKEEKYIVLKKKAVDEFFDQFTSGVFTTELESDAIAKVPFVDVLKICGTNNKYIVCNQDEPYAEQVWQLILDGERKKQEKKLNK